MKNVARWIALVALFTIPFLPLYVASDLFFPFITGKNFAFRILVEIALGAWIVLALLDKKYRPQFSWVLALFGGLVVWMMIANALGVLPYKAFWSNFERMDGWVMLVHAFAFFVVAGSLLSVEKLWRRWWLFFVGVSVAVCLFGVIQATGGATINQGGVRLDATFGNAIYLAVYLMFSIMMAGWLAITSKGWIRYALGGSILLSLIILFLTASRGPVIGLMAGVGAASVLWLVLALLDAREKNKQGVRIALGGLAALVLVVGGFFLIRDSAFVENTPALQRLSSVFTISEELEVRSTIWGIALKGVAEDPLTGWGQEGFNQIFNAYYEPSLYNQEAWFDRAHNMYMDYLVAGGVPALLLFLLLLAAAALALLRTDTYTRTERVLLIGALVAYGVQALVVFDNLFSYVPLVMLFAMAHAASSRSIPALETLPEVRSDTHVGVASAVALCAVLALIMTVNVPNIRAAGHLVYALSPSPKGVDENLALFNQALADGSFAHQEIREQLVSFATRVGGEESLPETLRMQFVTLAAEEMGKEVEVSPNDARLRLQYANALSAVGNDEGALLQIDEALRLSPAKQSIHLTRGFKLIELDRDEEARAAFRTAYELDPSFTDLAMTVAAGYIVSGDVPGGKEILVASVGTTTPDNETIFYAYYQTQQWSELVQVAEARVQSENGSPKSRFRLAQALAAAGRTPQAIAEVEATIAAHPSSRADGEALITQIRQSTR